MRKIKFKAKSKETGNWVYGYYSPLILPVFGEMAHFINEGGYRAIEIDEKTLCQYTNLKDKNGVEIYEGDIIQFVVFDHNGRDKEYKGVVKFEQSEWQIWGSKDSEYFGNGGAFHLGWVAHQDDELEVIGNIHDN